VCVCVYVFAGACEMKRDNDRKGKGRGRGGTGDNNDKLISGLAPVDDGSAWSVGAIVEEQTDVAYLPHN